MRNQPKQLKTRQILSATQYQSRIVHLLTLITCNRIKKREWRAKKSKNWEECSRTCLSQRELLLWWTATLKIQDFLAQETRNCEVRAANFWQVYSSLVFQTANFEKRFSKPLCALSRMAKKQQKYSTLSAYLPQ